MTFMKLDTPTLTSFYDLSQILNDDLYKVANAIKAYHDDDLYFSEIMQDISCASEDRIVKYSSTIEKLLDLPHKQLKEAAIGISFTDIHSYIKYLHHILSTNNVSYAPYIQRSIKRSKTKKNDNSLFDEVENGKDN